MDRAIIQWNIVNWITVFLMAVIGYTALSAAVTTWKTYAPQSVGGSA